MKPKKSSIINPAQWGISFSLKQCRNFGLDGDATLQWLLDQGFRRFRLMSYWNEHEKQPGIYDFASLDRQIKRITDAGGEISLCLGVKQPRWPEYHWPAWARELDAAAQQKALLTYVAAVVQRYQDEPAVTSWQLENEALLKGFGEHIAIDRKRLRAEFTLVRSLSDKPIIMSTSNGWGVPIRRPRPDRVGFSYYTVMFQKGNYHTTVQKPWLHRLRRRIISTLLRRSTFIHELQLEPWGHTAIWKMTQAEQDRSMSATRIAENLALAHAVGVWPIDLWGAEWWYWRVVHGDSSIIDAVRSSLTENTP